MFEASKISYANTFRVDQWMEWARNGIFAILGCKDLLCKERKECQLYMEDFNVGDFSKFLAGSISLYARNEELLEAGSPSCGVEY